MHRVCFTLQVRPDRLDEYRRRHNPIRLELEETLVAHGVTSYSIFLDPATSELFAYAEVEDEARWNAIASTDVCRRWWRHIRELMPHEPDDRPVARDLTEVFHIQLAKET